MLVVGGGVAGLTAAWHGARLGVSVALLEQGPLFGGQIATLGAIDDYPVAEAVPGADLAATLINAARRSGAAITEDKVVAITHSESLLAIKTARQALRARNIVIATGATLRKLDVPGASDKEGRGISQCPTCDGPMFRNRDVVVVGGGDGALQGALELARSCRLVRVVVRSRLRARQAYIDAASKCGNLRFVWDSAVEAVLGQTGVEGVRLRNLSTGSISELPCFGVFPLIGLTPNSGFAAATVERTRDGHIRVDKELQSSTPRVFAIGAVRDGFGGALVSAAGEGATVAEAIARRCRK